MMFRIISRVLSGLFTVILFSGNCFTSYFCTCCTDRGYYPISHRALRRDQFELLKPVKFTPTADLYMSAGAKDDIKGISPIAETYDFLG